MAIGTFTSGVRKISFCRNLVGPYQESQAKKVWGISGDLEIPILVGYIVAHQLNLADISVSQTLLGSQTDIANGHWIETHQFGCHGIDRHLILGGQQDVLDFRIMRRGPAPLPAVVPSIMANMPG